MITFEQYFGFKLPLAQVEHQVNARGMLAKVNALLEYALSVLSGSGFTLRVDEDTGCCISGTKGGAGDGGYRLSTSKTGEVSSKHRTGHAVDVFDPENKLDDWLTDDILERFGLWRERAEITLGWSHLQDVVTLTGKRSS